MANGDMQYSLWLRWCWLKKWNTSKTVFFTYPTTAPFSLIDKTFESMLCLLCFLWCKQRDVIQFTLFGASPAMDFLQCFSWDRRCTDQQCEACPSPRKKCWIIWLYKPAYLTFLNSSGLLTWPKVYNVSSECPELQPSQFSSPGQRAARS